MVMVNVKLLLLNSLHSHNIYLYVDLSLSEWKQETWLEHKDKGSKHLSNVIYISLNINLQGKKSTLAT